MSFDLSTIAPKARARYLRIGRRWGSGDTFAQANQTLKGLAMYGPDLIEHGFSEEDAEQLAGARDGLIEAGIGRDGARGDKKVTSSVYLSAIESGKDLRKSARVILQNTRRSLADKGDAGSEAGVTRIDVALQQTRSLDDDESKLAGQLDILHGVFLDPSVAPAVAKRGGPKAAIDLQAGADAIRAADAARAGSQGTPSETELLDLLDGIIVTLARDALKAAIAAAKRLGKPSMIAAFELTKLYPTRYGTTPAEPPVKGEEPTKDA